MRAYGAATAVLSIALVIIGLVMIVSTLARGGGPLSAGLILGLGFTVAGAGRLYTAWSPRG